jgi:hypothetical protein
MPGILVSARLSDFSALASATSASRKRDAQSWTLLARSTAIMACQRSRAYSNEVLGATFDCDPKFFEKLPPYSEDALIVGRRNPVDP